MRHRALTTHKNWSRTGDFNQAGKIIDRLAAYEAFNTNTTVTRLKQVHYSFRVIAQERKEAYPWEDRWEDDTERVVQLTLTSVSIR